MNDGKEVISQLDSGLVLMHGDCLERMKEIPDGSVDAIICDPPYQKTQNKWDSIIHYPFRPYVGASESNH